MVTHINAYLHFQQQLQFSLSVSLTLYDKVAAKHLKQKKLGKSGHPSLARNVGLQTKVERSLIAAL